MALAYRSGDATARGGRGAAARTGAGAVERAAAGGIILRAGLFNRFGLPMMGAGELPDMQITVTVSDSIIREAAARKLPLLDFVESLIDKGLTVAMERPVLNDAMERIRALRPSGQGPRR
jgi:hypothetical protein